MFMYLRVDHCVPRCGVDGLRSGSGMTAHPGKAPTTRVRRRISHDATQVGLEFAYIVGRAQMKFGITLRNRSGPRQLLKCTAAILRSCEIAFPSARVTPAEIRFVFDAFGPLRNYTWLVSATGPSSIITTFVLRLVITFSRFSEDT
jgi:hypothetical protein